MNYPLILSIAGAVIMLLLAILGFIFKAFFNEHKDMMLELGRLKGKIELNKQHADDEIRNLSKSVELQIEQCTQNIDMLTKQISNLLEIFLKTNHKG